jgi:outer membrane receptor protein involved in Fe transport
MYRRILFFAFVLFGISAGYSQRPGGGGSQGMPAEGVVRGEIFDAYSGKPMEYANVVLFSYRDSSMVSGTVTDQEGAFTMRQVPYGRFYLVANFIGFNRLTLEEIRITPNNKMINLGQMKLDPAAESLEAIEVVAEKEHIEFQIDKRVVNVSQDVMAQGGTAVTALENTPSVQVDIEGNVSLRGSSSFTVLVDGRPSVLTGSDALQQIPASNIDRIEIITNPSAKYDPDGVAGIINVILKQQKMQGVNGIVNLSVGTKDKYSGDFLLNYRTGKVNIFGGMDYRDYNFGGGRESRQEMFLPDTTRFLSSFGDRSMNRGGYSFRAGADYYVTDRTTLSFIGQLGKFEFQRGLTSNQSDFTVPASETDYRRTISLASRESDYYRLTLNFQHNIDELGQKIEAMAYYSQRDGMSYNDQTEYETDENWIVDDVDPYRIRTNETGDDSEIRFKVDYTKPFNENTRFEAGYQGRIDTDIEDYQFTNWDEFAEEWIEDPDFSNSMDFHRSIHSVYGMYASKLNQIGYQLGLRGEYTYREISNMQGVESSVIDRMDYFPTVHLSYTFPNKDQVQASYTRRIDRPRGWSLDPFTMYIDAFSRRQGNPNLKPEYTDSYEAAYQKRIWNSLISLEGYYRVTTDLITRIRTLESDGIFLYTFDNVNNDYSLGSELMINTTPVKWLELNLSGNLFHYRIEGSVSDTEVDTESLNWNGTLNATFRLPEDFRLQANGRYSGPSVTPQGERKGYFTTNVALRKDFFNRQLSVTASIRDVFKSAKWEHISSGTGFTSFDSFERESQVVMINLSYRINNYTRKRTPGDINGSDMDMGGDDL